MSDAPHTTVNLLFKNMMKTYLPPVDPDGFDAVYSTEKIARIHSAFSAAVNNSSGNDDLVKERVISKAWVRYSSVSLSVPMISTDRDHSTESTRPRRSAQATC